MYIHMQQCQLSYCNKWMKAMLKWLNISKQRKSTYIISLLRETPYDTYYTRQFWKSIQKWFCWNKVELNSDIASYPVLNPVTHVMEFWPSGFLGSGCCWGVIRVLLLSSEPDRVSSSARRSASLHGVGVKKKGVTRVKRSNVEPLGNFRIPKCRQKCGMYLARSDRLPKGLSAPRRF
jgi:hypothetical protein